MSVEAAPHDSGASSEPESKPPPATDSGPRALPAIPEQGSIITSAQLRSAGWSRDAVRHATDRRIRRVFPRVFATHMAPLDANDLLVAAYLWAGEGAVLTGRVALDRHGLTVPCTGPCLFLVPSTHRTRRTTGVVTMRTMRPMPVAMFRGCVPITTVDQALCDAAVHQELGGDELRALAIAALQRRLTHPDRLRDALGQRATGRLRPIRQALDEFCAGAWSLPEAALARVLTEDPELADCVFNAELRTPDGALIGVPDGYFEDGGVAVQVHSKAYHSGFDEKGRDRWSDTVEKDGDMTEHGVVVLQVTPASIERRPDAVLARIRRVVGLNRGRRLGEVIVRGRVAKR